MMMRRRMMMMMMMMMMITHCEHNGCAQLELSRLLISGNDAIQVLK